jgi:hypothetical protein
MTIVTAIRSALLALLVLVAAAVPAAAQQQELAPDHLAMARRFVDLTDHGNLYEQVILQTGIDTRKVILNQHPEIAEKLTTALVASLNSYRDRKNELMDQVARIYALRFSLEELTQIVAFYESDVGKKLSASNKAINEDTRLVLGVYRNNLRTEFYSKVRAELKLVGVDI